MPIGLSPSPSPTRRRRHLTNIHVVSATEYTVTLAWDPESPVVGPATFSVFIPHPWHSPRGSGGGVNYQLIGSTTSTNITIINLTPNTSYGYALNATAAGGTSGYAGISATHVRPAAADQSAGDRNHLHQHQPRVGSFTRPGADNSL